MVTAYRPRNLEEALSSMQKPRATPLAGGTDLMVRHRNWPGLPPRFEGPLVFIGHLDEIKGIDEGRNTITIGSACTLTSILQNKEVPQILRTVVALIASPSIRNRGTIGGNICNGSPAGDTLPTLYALDAILLLQREGETRKLPIADFISGPGETVLRDGELLTGIILPKKEFDLTVYRKIGTRAAYSCSKLSLIGLVKYNRVRVSDVRIALGAVAPTVLRSQSIEERMVGKTVGEIEGMIPEITQLYAAKLKPIDDQRSTACYRSGISIRLLRHFLQTMLIPKRG
jgi:CO/xanthine dehydrogenase FAD-binding subunit